MPRTVPRTVLVLFTSGALACGGPQLVEHDAGGRDAAIRDAATPPVDASGPDATVPVDGGSDGGLPSTSSPAPAAEIVRTGSGGLLLRGTVLAPAGPIAGGEVLVIGNSIACVAQDCGSDPRAAGVTVIDTHATISAGLIDGHNHLTYNFLPEWIPDPMRLFGSRYDWRADPDYSAHTQPESDGGTRGAFVCPATKWAELRSIVHGTTTVQGQSPEQACVNRLARNADHFHGLGPDHMQTTISGACEAGLNDAARTTLVANFSDGSTTRYAVHMAEGVTASASASTNVMSEYACYAGEVPARATISLLEDAAGQPFETAIFIHAIPLTDAQLVQAQALDARVVWSPSSNI
ncbi:MAG: hypothetical protein K8H88_01580, partial [Sandaracinaceae bacterium]|nr:hypothetical protein [Sandaracinaceae bacterium]